MLPVRSISIFLLLTVSYASANSVTEVNGNRPLPCDERAVRLVTDQVARDGNADRKPDARSLETDADRDRSRDHERVDRRRPVSVHRERGRAVHVAVGNVGVGLGQDDVRRLGAGATDRDARDVADSDRGRHKALHAKAESLQNELSSLKAKQVEISDDSSEDPDDDSEDDPTEPGSEELKPDGDR